MINEKISASGIVSLVLLDQYGEVKQEVTRNLVVDAGLAFIVSRMAGTTQAVMSHIAVGTGTTAAADAQTALVTELTRVACTPTIVTTTVANDTMQYVATLNPGTGDGAITEAGIFNAASAGTMLARTVFSVINKGALDTLVITWKVTVA